MSQRPAIAKERPDLVPAKHVFERLSLELRDLHLTAEKLEDLVATLSSGNGSTTDEYIRGIQSVDFIRQSLQALADFTTILSVDSESSGYVDPEAAASAVRLRALADRLSGQQEPAPETAVVADEADDDDLFL